MTNHKNTLHFLKRKADGISQTTCPTMDLMALTSDNGSILSLYRKSGEDQTPVWETNISTLGHGTINSVIWKPDGRQIAIITSKNQCLICDSNTCLILSTIQGETNNVHDVGFSVGGWFVTSSYINKSNNNKNAKAESKLRFKGSAMNLDLLKSLPKLPPLPSQAFNANWNTTGGGVAAQHKFTTKQALETMIHNFVEDDLDLLFLFTESKVNIVFHDLFSIGDIELIPENLEDEEIVNYITTSKKLDPYSAKHYIITSSFTTMQYKLRRFETGFVQYNNYEYLQEITSSSSKIIALQGYIDEVLTHCLQDIKNYLDFSNRFIGILRSELQEQNKGTAGDELYNLLLTGMMEDEVKDWIENTIGERGVKRWIKASELSFDGTRRSIVYHIAPACERILLLLGNLGGAIKSYEMVYGNNDDFVQSDLLKSAKESVKEMLKTVFDFIQKVNKEQTLFNAFISWMQVCLSDLQDEKPKVTYTTSEVSEFLNTFFEKSGLLFFTPFMKRATNSVKIHTNELFKIVKRKIQKSVVTDKEFSQNLGMITESQQMTQIEDYLFIITHHDTMVEIHQFDLITEKLRKISISMFSQIQDLKLSNSNTTPNDRIVNVLSSHELFQFSIDNLISKLQESLDATVFFNISELPCDYLHQTFQNMEVVQHQGSNLGISGPSLTLNSAKMQSTTTNFKPTYLTSMSIGVNSAHVEPILSEKTNIKKLNVTGRKSLIGLISCDKETYLTID